VNALVTSGVLGTTSDHNRGPQKWTMVVMQKSTKHARIYYRTLGVDSFLCLYLLQGLVLLLVVAHLLDQARWGTA